MLSGINPFKVKNKNKFEKLQMITDSDIAMMPIFSEDARSLLEGFLERNPKKRLGSGKEGLQDIKDHPFFAEIEWEKLLQKKIKAPFVPKIEGDLDLGNRDRVFTKEAPRETPENSDRPLRKAKFDNFTYKGDSSYLNGGDEDISFVSGANVNIN